MRRVLWRRVVSACPSACPPIDDIFCIKGDQNLCCGSLVSRIVDAEDVLLSYINPTLPRRASSRSSSPDLARLVRMDQLDFNTQPGASLPTNEVVERLTNLEANLVGVTQTLADVTQTLAEVTQNLAEVNRKVDSLLDLFVASNTPNYHLALERVVTLRGAGTSLAPAPHQVLDQSWLEPGHEFGMSGMSPLSV